MIAKPPFNKAVKNLRRSGLNLIVTLIGAALILLMPLQSAANDFPTNARAEYVFACMSTSEQTKERLDKCSCSIDKIAEFMSYHDYEAAETVLRMRQLRSGRASVFRNLEWMNRLVQTLRAAQAEAEIQCF